MPVSPAQKSLKVLKESILAETKPQVGIMVSQPRYDKALKHQALLLFSWL